MARWLRWGGMASVVVFLLVILAVPLYAETPQASTITVSSVLDVLDSEDGVCTLREAISAANDDVPSGDAAGECVAGSGEDTVLIPTGTYTLTREGRFENENLTGDMDILAAVTISATGAVTVNATAIERVFPRDDGLVELRRPTITRGAASSGSGIRAMDTLHLVD